MTDEIQRSIGRLEGDVRQILDIAKRLQVDFQAHVSDDKANFTGTYHLIADNRKALEQKLDTYDGNREKHLNEQDHRLEKIEKLNSFATGAGWVIIGLITFLGAVVIAALSGVKFH